MKEVTDYYEYTPDGSATWMLKAAPARNLLFEEELTKFSGVNTFGEPILRVQWAGTLANEFSEKPALKYKQMWKGLVGFDYTNDDGDVVRVRDARTAPADKFVTAVYDTIELGRLRWIVEAWQSKEHAVKSGREDADGIKIPATGTYNAFFWIETLDKKYRALDMGVLEAVKGMWHYSEAVSIDQKYADFISDSKKEQKENTAAAREMWQSV